MVALTGMTYRECAMALGIPVGTVMSRLARARGTSAADPGRSGSGQGGAAAQEDQVTTRSGLPDETELHAYADGQLPAERIAAVEGWLAEDAEARARLASWRAQNELIFRLYDSPVEPSTAAWLSHRLQQRTRGWRQAAAAALVALIVGTGAGWLAHARLAPVPEPMAVLARAAIDLEQMSSRGDLPGQVGLPSPELAEQLSQALAHPVLIPDLEDGRPAAGRRAGAADRGRQDRRPARLRRCRGRPVHALPGAAGCSLRRPAFSRSRRQARLAWSGPTRSSTACCSATRRASA